MHENIWTTYETLIKVLGPSADRTINFPDVSGNVVTTGDTGTVDKARHKAATAPNLIHSLDASLLCLSALNFNNPIALIHDCLKVLPNDMDMAKSRIKFGFFQACKGDPLDRLANDMEVFSDQLLRLTQGKGNLSAVNYESSYMFN